MPAFFDPPDASRVINAMSVYRSEVVHTSILAPPRDVVVFLSDMTKWETWAPWIRSVRRTAARDWTLETEAGRMKVHFVEENALGVLRLRRPFTTLRAIRRQRHLRQWECMLHDRPREA